MSTNNLFWCEDMCGSVVFEIMINSYFWFARTKSLGGSLSLLINETFYYSNHRELIAGWVFVVLGYIGTRHPCRTPRPSVFQPHSMVPPCCVRRFHREAATDRPIRL